MSQSNIYLQPTVSKSISIDGLNSALSSLAGVLATNWAPTSDPLTNRQNLDPNTISGNPMPTLPTRAGLGVPAFEATSDFA
jgi:hypothetical protein